MEGEPRADSKAETRTRRSTRRYGRPVGSIGCYSADRFAEHGGYGDDLDLGLLD